MKGRQPPAPKGLYRERSLSLTGRIGPVWLPRTEKQIVTLRWVTLVMLAAGWSAAVSVQRPACVVIRDRQSGIAEGHASVAGDILALS